MPLVIKVSVSRKLSQDYNSRGWTLDIQSEFDPRTFDDTDALANSTNHLFAIANNLLDEQVAGSVHGSDHRGNGDSGNGESGHRLLKQNPDSGNGNGNGGKSGSYGHQLSGRPNGHANGSKSNGANGRKERPITAAQINAIQKMATRLDTIGDAVAQEDFNTPLSQLTIKQASALIDNLKKAIEVPSGQGVNS